MRDDFYIRVFYALSLLTSIGGFGCGAVGRGACGYQPGAFGCSSAFHSSGCEMLHAGTPERHHYVEDASETNTRGGTNSAGVGGKEGTTAERERGTGSEVSRGKTVAVPSSRNSRSRQPWSPKRRAAYGGRSD
ncbi:hypothetical protein B7463_g4168, partial [Scytalidium lignicola]